MGEGTVACTLIAGLALIACSSTDGASKKPPNLDGMIHSFITDEDNLPVPGVEVCVASNPAIPCVTSDAGGIADLPVPKDRDMILRYSKTGFIPKRRQIFSSDDKAKGLGNWGFQRKSWYELQAQALQGTLDLGKGMVALVIGNGTGDIWSPTVPNAGATFDFQPASGNKDPGIKQFEFQIGTDSKLGVCVSGSTCEAGIVGYLDVPPDKYTAVFHAEPQTCAPQAFPCTDGTASCLGLEVVAGELTVASMPCK